MSASMVKFLMSMLDQKILLELIIGILRELAKKTSNTLDDKAVDLLAKSLGV